MNQPDPGRITIAEVASRVSVSTSAVPRVITGLARVHPRVRHCVLETFGNDTPYNNDRLKGFHAALHRTKRKSYAKLFVHGNYSQVIGARVTEALLARGALADASFAANDQMAIEAMLVLQQHGFQVSEEMAVVGLDDISMANSILPPLTTVQQPSYELGLQAARQLEW